MEPIKQSKDTLRIKKLCIPPNWKDVKISKDPTSYLQVTGIDIAGRMQYIYHPLFVSLTSKEKFSRLDKFCKVLPNFMLRIRNIKSTSPDYMMAILFKIMYKTFVRVGNECYNTYGLTTLEKRHFKIENDTVTLNYIGKKNVEQNVQLIDKNIANYLTDLISNKKQNEKVFSISSYEMNDYLKKYCGPEFSCKDFRTYASNLLFIKMLQFSIHKYQMLPKKIILKNVYAEVAKHLGHTEKISKKSYVMSVISDKFISDTYLFKNKINPEKLLMKFCKEI